MNHAFRRLALEREASLQDDEPRRYSVLFALLETVRRYARLLATHDELQSVTRDTVEMLERLLATLDGEDPGLADLLEWARIRAREAPEVAPDPSTLEPWLAELDQIDAELSRLDLGAQLTALEVDRQAEVLWDSVDGEIPEEELRRGHYEGVSTVLTGFVDGETPLEECLDQLGRVQAQLEQVRSDYEGTYLGADEWTVEVALADRLLCEGVGGWLEGLERIQEHCRRGRLEALAGELSGLLAANRLLILVERLNRLEGPFTSGSAS